MPSDCSRYEDKLSTYLDGRLSPKEMADVVAHLEICASCASALDKMKRLDDMAADAITGFDEAVLDELSQRIDAALDKEAPKVPAEQPLRAKPVPIWYRYVAVAASIAIVFFAGRTMFRDAGSEVFMTRPRPKVSPSMHQAPTPPRDTASVRGAAADSVSTGSRAKSLPEVEPTAEKEIDKDAGAAAPTVAPSQLREDRPLLSTEEKQTVAVPAEMPGKGEAVPTVDETGVVPEPAKKTLTGEGGAMPLGEITGKVTDKSTGEELSGVAVRVEGTRLGAKTDVHGNFVIQSVPSDTYNVVYSSIGYETVKSAEVPVNPDQVTDQSVTMKPSVLESGKITQVTGHTKGIDFNYSDTGVAAKEKIPSAEVNAIDAEGLLSHKPLAASAPESLSTLLPVDSLKTVYAAMFDTYQRAEIQGDRRALVPRAAGVAETSGLQRFTDSLESITPLPADPARRIELLYFRVRANYDRYVSDGDTEYLARARSFKEMLTGLLAQMADSGYDRARLDEYRRELDRLDLKR